MTAATPPETGRHILTVVIEDYFQVGAFSRWIPRSHWERFEARVERNTLAALDLLEATGTRATFFTCGWIAERHPEIIAEVVRRGHEIGSQGYAPRGIGGMTPQQFRNDLRQSRDLVECAAGTAVRGFRIGHGWIGPKDLWVLDELAREGFAYDSSLCPIGRQFADDPERRVMHRHHGPSGPLWEIPVSTLRMAGLSLPVSGGNYLRQLPDRPMRWAIDNWVRERTDPLVLYFHVWELDPDQPSIAAASRLQRLRHYRNLSGMSDRVRRYLETYRFTTAADRLGLPPAEPKTCADPIAAMPIAVRSEAVGRTPLTIVIPCYNEEATLPFLARTLDRFAQREGTPYDLRHVFVDDGSSDGTWNALHERFGGRDDCRFVRHEVNRGVAAAVLTGIEAAATDLVAVIDADCTFNPQQLVQMMPLMTEGVDVVAASPFHHRGGVNNVPGWRLLLSRGAGFLYRLVLHHKFSSYTSCFRLYRRNSVVGMQLINQGFCGMAEILGRMDLAGRQLVECPAILEVRLLGQSKINTLTTILDHLRLIARLAAARWLGRPLPTTASLAPRRVRKNHA